MKVERKKKGSSSENKAEREDDGIKQNSFLINQSNEITFAKKAERNENLKAAEKYALTPARKGMSQCPFL